MNKIQAIDSLKQKVRRKGLKLTKQREVICDVFFSQKGHRSAEEILHDVRSFDAHVSLATVYRTLKLLQENGFAKSHNFQEGLALFEPSLDEDEHHDHLICTRCNKIVEFVNQEIEELQVRVAQQHGFVVTHHKMELYGLCAKCRRDHNL